MTKKKCFQFVFLKTFAEMCVVHVLCNGKPLKYSFALASHHCIMLTYTFLNSTPLVYVKIVSRRTLYKNLHCTHILNFKGSDSFKYPIILQRVLTQMNPFLPSEPHISNYIVHLPVWYSSLGSIQALAQKVCQKS